MLTYPIGYGYVEGLRLILQAIQYYDKALDIDPNYKEALSGKVSTLDGIGNAFYNQGKYTRSIQYYNKTLAINSTNSSALYGKQDAVLK